MTALAAHELKPRLRVRRLVGAVIIGMALAALTGVSTSRLVSPDRDAKTVSSFVVDAGPARVAMPAAWQPVAPARRLPGLESEQLAVLSPPSDVSTMAVVAFGTADGRSVIPRPLAELIDPPRTQPRVTSLAGRPAWVYRDLSTTRRNLMMDVTVLPTTAGMLALACASPEPSGDAGPGCASLMKSVSVRGVAALEPSPSFALAVRLRAMLAPLDHARADGRAALRRARTPESQAVALHRLADQHLAAADRLRTAVGTAARPLIADLEDSGRAYATLGDAASDGSPARFGAARRGVRAADAELASAIERIHEAGTHETAVGTSTSPAAMPATTARPLVTRPIFVIVLLLGSCVAGFAVSGRLGDATTKLRRAGPGPGRA